MYKVELISVTLSLPPPDVFLFICSFCFLRNKCSNGKSTSNIIFLSFSTDKQHCSWPWKALQFIHWNVLLFIVKDSNVSNDSGSTLLQNRLFLRENYIKYIHICTFIYSPKTSKETVYLYVCIHIDIYVASYQIKKWSDGIKCVSRLWAQAHYRVVESYWCSIFLSCPVE